MQPKYSARWSRRELRFYIKPGLSGMWSNGAWSQ